MLQGKNILIGITGGIAAYKICSLIRLYKKAGANVRVIITEEALHFVTKLTLQTLSGNDVYVNPFEIPEYKPEHIALCDEADIFVIAPATANTISKIANGIADNLLLSTACAFKKQIIIAPSMNTGMWENTFLQENIDRLKKHGYIILEPSTGYLACGTDGKGRMLEPEEIFSETENVFAQKKKPGGKSGGKSGGKLEGIKILITAGGTKEKIDPVRYITNCSSGKMGLALADSAYNMGADVTLISTFNTDKPYKNVLVETALEMESEVKKLICDMDYVIMAAAVSDYRVAEYSEQKIKKKIEVNEGKLTLNLVPNPDILKGISALNTNTKIVGFCAESENLLENAKTKIKNKGCDYLVANDISRKDIGFSSDENEVYILDKDLNITHIKKDSKQIIAQKILEKIFE